MGLLIELKRIEALAGRKPGKRWGPRSLDIDIITYGDQKIKTPWLTVPHPEATKRSFVLVPLLEIAPNACLTRGVTVSRALSRLKVVAVTPAIPKPGSSFHSGLDSGFRRNDEYGRCYLKDISGTVKVIQ